MLKQTINMVTTQYAQFTVFVSRHESYTTFQMYEYKLM